MWKSFKKYLETFFLFIFFICCTQKVLEPTACPHLYSKKFILETKEEIKKEFNHPNMKYLNQNLVTEARIFFLNKFNYNQSKVFSFEDLASFHLFKSKNVIQKNDLIIINDKLSFRDGVKFLIIDENGMPFNITSINNNNRLQASSLLPGFSLSHF